MLLHGHQDGWVTRGGRVYAEWGELDRAAARGWLAVAVSLPGYGGSSGPADFAGPDTQAAVRAVIAALGPDRGRLAIEGVSLGAVTAALLASDDAEVAGLVLVSGLYDLPAFLDPPHTAAATAIAKVARQQTGGGHAALLARSALSRAGRIRADTLILAGGKDDRTDPAQAVRLAAAIRAGGGRAKAIVYPDAGHAIPIAARQAAVDAFLKQVLAR